MKPKISSLELDGFHRLIPSRFSASGTVLSDIADSDKMLEDLILLDGATNDRIQGEQQGLIGISPYELIYGIPNAHIINAAFTHAQDTGSRFNDHTRGAWYAADELDTSVAEVAYHKARRLSEIVVPELADERPANEVSTYDDWLADFRARFHVLQPAEKFPEYLKATPLPQCYVHSQQLARRLLEIQSNGIFYPSVRRPGFNCLVCFRPALIYNIRRVKRLEISFKSRLSTYEHKVRAVAFS